MTTRARGLWIIVRTVAPAVAIVVVALASSTAIAAMRDSAAAYGVTVSAELADVTEVFQDVGAALGRLAEFATGIGAAIAATFRAIASISPQISIPPFDISLGLFTIPAGTFTFDVPGLGVIIEFFRTAADAAAAVAGNIKEELERIFVVPESIDRISTATAQLGSEVRDAAGQWLATVLLMAVLVLVAWIATRTRTILGELGRGWAMLLGRPVTPASLASLRTRVDELERRLASRS